MTFWLILIVVFVVASGRRRRWERWADPRYLPPGHPWARRGAEPPAPERDAYIDQLESRVARLEERLDFTEKLLVERSRERQEQRPE